MILKVLDALKSFSRTPARLCQSNVNKLRKNQLTTW